MIGGTGGVYPYLEAALMADGVSMEDIYPIDIDRAYESLDQGARLSGQVVGHRRVAGTDADRQGGGAGRDLEWPHPGPA